jgi:serine/threonine protein kinase
MDLPMSSGHFIVGKRNLYRIEREITAGGMGYVYAARSSSGENVIVKTTRFYGDSLDQVRLERLKTEARILSILDHPNIVRYIDHRDDGERFYLVIEMIRGRTLKDEYLGRPASESTVKKYALLLLETLRYLHGHQVVHRDVNPKNLVLDPYRELILIDFGAARQGYGQTTGLGKYVGTEYWSDPEQFTTGLVSVCNDIYAVGSTMFFLLTGEEPRKYLTDRKSLTKLPHQITPSVSRELSRIVKIAMDPNPSERFQTTDEMISLIKKGYTATSGQPHIVFQGRRYEIRGDLEIGRAHKCDSDCSSKNFHSPLDLSISDPGRYVDRHHARLSIDRSGTCWIEDFGSLNCPAISHDGGRTFKTMPRNERTRLHEGDTVAIVYSDRRGAYMTFTFRAM